MPYSRNYPATVTEVLDPNIKLKPSALAALKKFRRAKPWRGSLVARWQIFQTLNTELSAAYGIEPPTLILQGNGKGDSGGSCYSPATHTICISGRLSVCTFLHEHMHARGADEREACRWSISVYARLWPASFAKCGHEGHVLRLRRPS